MPWDFQAMAFSLGNAVDAYSVYTTDYLLPSSNMKVMPLVVLMLAASVTLGSFARVFAAEPKSPPDIGESISAAEKHNFGFTRSIDPRWFPHDARQWEGYGHSILLTDLATARPATALSHQRRQKNKWQVLPYVADTFQGNALSIYPSTKPVPVTISLGPKGWHAVYLGLSTVHKLWGGTYESGVRAKLGRSPTYRRIGNNINLLEAAGGLSNPQPRFRDAIREQLVTIADLAPGDTLEIASFWDQPATVAYIRLVPLNALEQAAALREESDARHRSAVVTNDGHYWIFPYLPRTAGDLLQPFEGFQTSDFAQWWFCPLGADLVCYPSELGTILGQDTTDFFRPLDEDYNRSLQALIDAGVNPLVVAREEARKQGREFHVILRPQGFGASIPYEETFNSKFYRAHPEWRTVDREGRQAMFMSYAVPEVRQQVLGILREAVETCDPDGVGFFFNRGVPLMLWEKAFADRFRSAYGLEIMMVEAEDPRIPQLRRTIMTEYLREVRAMLDEKGRARNGKHYAISVTVFTEKSINERLGLDIEVWVKEGLVDQVASAWAPHFDQGRNPPPDIQYYRKVVTGTKVKFFPFVIGGNLAAWNESGKLEDFCRSVTQWYQAGVDGIAAWDVSPGDGFRHAKAEGDSLDLMRYIGHRDLIAYWAEHGVPRPNIFPLKKLGENEYSIWYPNTGY